MFSKLETPSRRREDSSAATGIEHDISPLAIISKPIATLLVDPRNARTHKKRQIRQIAESIKAFGFNVPILIDREGKVIAGHGRLEACKLLGWAEVPTISLEHLTPEQARAFAIADNRLTDTSTWDDQLLGEALKELASLDLDFSIEATGFSVTEIDLRIEGLTLAPDEPVEDAAPEPHQGPAISRLGDLWILGEHHVLCGSALEAADYAKLLGTEQASMIFTDPPYSVPISGHVSGLGKIKHREFVMGSGEMTSGEFEAFLKASFELMARHSANGSIHFVFMDWRHMSEILAAGTSAYTELKNLCVWAKTNGGMGSLYRGQHELVFVFKSGSAPHTNNVELGRHGRHRTNVWTYPGANTFGRGHDEEGDLLALHPTPKPVQLVADAILDCSRRRAVILDPFLGSGTTLIAAERTGRRCFGLELDPLYVDTIIARWQRLTGGDARLESTGETFEAITEARKAARHD